MIHRYTFTGPSGDKEFQDSVCAWLEANGITPESVPVRARFGIADGQITYEEMRRSPDGTGRLPGRFARTVPLLVPMPPELDERTDWRQPPHLCDRCGADLEES